MGLTRIWITRAAVLAGAAAGAIAVLTVLAATQAEAAVTIDWVALTAGILLVGVAAMTSVLGATRVVGDGTCDIQDLQCAATLVNDARYDIIVYADHDTFDPETGTALGYVYLLSGFDFDAHDFDLDPELETGTFTFANAEGVVLCVADYRFETVVGGAVMISGLPESYAQDEGIDGTFAFHAIETLETPVSLRTPGGFEVFAESVTFPTLTGTMTMARARDDGGEVVAYRASVDFHADLDWTGFVESTSLAACPGMTPWSYDQAAAGTTDVSGNFHIARPGYQSIDIKPSSDPNVVNLGSGGSVPVAILSSVEFDATRIDPQTILLADAGVKVRGKGVPQVSIDDIDGDGRLDLMTHVVTDQLQLTNGETAVQLTASTYDGEAFSGWDDIEVVP